MKRSNYKWCHGSRVDNDTRQTSSYCRGLITNNRLFRLLHLSKISARGHLYHGYINGYEAMQAMLVSRNRSTPNPPAEISTTANNKERRTTNTNQPTIHQGISEPTTNNQQPTTNNTSACIFSTVNPQPLRHLVLRSFQRTDRSCQRS